MVTGVWYDRWMMLRLARPLHLWQLLLLRLSFYASRMSKKAIHWGMPLHISVEPTTSCNLRCPECPSGLRAFSRPTGMLEPSFFEGLLNELKPGLASINFYFQGEPYLNRELHGMVRKAADAGIYTATSTNGHYLDSENCERVVQSGLHRLIVSIDGTSQDTYEQYRIGGKLEKVIEGTRLLIDTKRRLKSRTPHVVFQFLVVKPNEHQIPEVLELAGELGVDEVRFKTAQVYDFEQGNPLIPENEKYARYRKGADGRWVLKNKLENHCWRMWQGCVVTWDGSIVPCCFDKDAQHRLGKIDAQTRFGQIWRSEEYRAFRAGILEDRSQFEICKNCTEGTKAFG